MSTPPEDRNPDQPTDEKEPASVEKRAVKTTIVGGQPPGNERPLPPIPVGIEEVLGMASVNDEFAQALYSDRSAAVQASGVELTATEHGILGAIDDGSLRQMVGNVEGAVPNRERRAFLARSAAALLVLAGGGAAAAAAACSDSKPKPSTKPTPPVPADAAAAPPDPADAAAAPPPPPDARPRPVDPPRPPTGINPDRPLPQTRGISPDRPPPPTRGVRPDRPPQERRPTKGIRPDIPPPKETFKDGGARPDRPDEKKP